MRTVPQGAESEVSVSRINAVAVPGWSELPWLVHGFSTRQGGRTTVYRPDRAETDGDLNLGFTAQDSRGIVAGNRGLWLSSLLGKAEAGRSASLVTLRQTHSSIVHRVSDSDASSVGNTTMLEGDGLITDVPGLLLGILTADCVPVLVADRRRRAVAAFHAGWRGTLQQIVEHGITRMREEFGSKPGDLVAAIGPAIGACCYSVGEEVRAQFAAQFPYADDLFSAGANDSVVTHRGAVTRLDLAEANRRQLLAAGLADAAITTTRLCTSCNTDRFFSHRAESGVTGRMMAVIGMRA